MSFTANKGLQTNRGHSIFTGIFDQIKEYSVPALYLVVLLVLILVIVSRYFPKVGHDYGFFLPRMLDTHLHHRINGLGIQWYTANFGAGTPAYANPQYIQYSFPQFLMFVVNPWTAVMLSLATYAVLGFTCFYLFLHHDMGWISNASALGASFILANGFFIDHAIVGHLGFQNFPLLGVILFLAFNKRLNSLLAGVLIGLVIAMMVNQAGFVVLTMFVFSLLILFPLIYLLRSAVFDRRLFTTLWISALSATLLSISKVSAVMAFMRFFPRFIEDNYGETYAQGIMGMGKQLTGLIFIVPHYMFTGRSLNDIPSFFQKGTGTSFGIWEINLFLSPGLVVLLILGVGHGVFKFKRATLRITIDKVIALLCLYLAVWLATDMSLAQGWLFKLVKPLPVIRSLHANIRYTATLIFPLSLLGAYIFHQLFKDKKTGNHVVFALLGISTIVILCLYFVIPQDVYNRSFNIKSVLSTYPQIDRGKNFTLTNIANITDMEVFQTGNSNLASQDPMFGYVGEYFKPEIVPGPIMEIREGHYNLTNPAGYVFPKENNLQPFEPFRADEKTDLELFINHKQPNLKISNWQKFADGLNLVALIVASFYLIFKLTKGTIRVWQTTFQPDSLLEERVI